MKKKKNGFLQLIRFFFVIIFFSLLSLLIPGLGFHTIWSQIWLFLMGNQEVLQQVEGIPKRLEGAAESIIERIEELTAGGFARVTTDQVLRTVPGVWDETTAAGVVTPADHLTIGGTSGEQVQVTFINSEGDQKKGWVNIKAVKSMD